MKQASQTASDHRIEPIPAMRLAGLARSYPATAEAMQGLARQWQDLAHGPGGKLLAAGPVMYGIHTGLFGQSGEDEYFSGIEIGAQEPLPAGLSELRLPAITCAVIDHGGPAGDISQTTSILLRDGLHRMGRRLAEARPFDLIERYGRNFDPRTARGDIQLIVPVED